MDITTRVIAEAKVNDDLTTGLARYSQVTDINISGENNGTITVKGRIALLSPTGKCMYIENKWEFVRFDRSAVYKDLWVIDSPVTYYEPGEPMADGNLAQGGEIKTPEVGHFENVLDKPANLKYTLLEQSGIGLGIKQMLGLDLAGAIVNDVWVPANLMQA